MDQARTLRELMGVRPDALKDQRVTVTLTGAVDEIGVHTLADWFESYLLGARVVPTVLRQGESQSLAPQSGPTLELKVFKPKEDYLSYERQDFHVLVVSTERDSLRNAYEFFRKLRDKRAITRIGIIVNKVTDVEMIPVLLNRLCEYLENSHGLSDVQLDYLGHCFLDKNIPGFHFSRENLLQSKEELLSFRCLEMLGRRLVGWCFESQLQLNETQDEGMRI